ncbi:MAG: phage tail sheath family protein [Methylobacter sp.]
MVTYKIPKTPGVYVEEISTLAPSVAPVTTAVPVFIGYTEKGPELIPTRIDTLLDYESVFGRANPSKFSVTVNNPGESSQTLGEITRTDTKKFLMYYGLSLYFQNGGGSCYILSVGGYSNSAPDKTHFVNALNVLETEDEPTLIVLLDATALCTIEEYYGLCNTALKQCKKLGDRFLIVDIPDGKTDSFRNSSTFGKENLSYAAAYYPYLNTSLNYLYYDETNVEINSIPENPKSEPVAVNSIFKWTSDDIGIEVSYSGAASDQPAITITNDAGGAESEFDISPAKLLTIKFSSTKAPNAKDFVASWGIWKTANAAKAKGFEIKVMDGKDSVELKAAAAQKLTKEQVPPEVPKQNATQTLADLKQSNTALYNQIKSSLDNHRVTLPPSPAIAGVYASVDRDRGVWKTPANVSLSAVIGPVTKISDTAQDDLNIDPTAGKSINAIRSFTGKGTLVWGGRTLAGNDNEWRYISVRRLFITIEESTRKASAFAVFEPNDATTWLKVKAMIESYLYGLWQQGALAGSKPELAYFVSVGLGKTMTAQDILEGRMIVNIGVAAVRPAEFIILCFSHKMQEA